MDLLAVEKSRDLECRLEGNKEGDEGAEMLGPKIFEKSQLELKSRLDLNLIGLTHIIHLG